jgi:hypothetical protein
MENRKSCSLRPSRPEGFPGGGVIACDRKGLPLSYSQCLAVLAGAAGAGLEARISPALGAEYVCEYPRELAVEDDREDVEFRDSEAPRAPALELP